MKNCIFCNIMSKKIPADFLYENKYVVAFKDIKPVAPIHILIVPKTHIETIDHLEPRNEKLIGEMIYTAQKLARSLKISENGYRLVFNVKSHGGQLIDHIHLHLIGGKKLGSMS